MHFLQVCTQTKQGEIPGIIQCPTLHQKKKNRSQSDHVEPLTGAGLDYNLQPLPREEYQPGSNQAPSLPSRNPSFGPSALSGQTLWTAMPRILPRLIKALQRPPGPFEDEIRVAPGLRSKARRKIRTVPPHKQHIPVRVSRPAAEYSKSLLLDVESQVKRRKGPSPVVKYQGQDGARMMNEDELRWWSNPYRAYVSPV